MITLSDTRFSDYFEQKKGRVVIRRIVCIKTQQF